jgi:hypothetical protein
MSFPFPIPCLSFIPYLWSSVKSPSLASLGMKLEKLRTSDEYRGEMKFSLDLESVT